MAVTIRRKKGKKFKTITLLNPAEKRAKYKLELETGVHYTNSMNPKTKNGEWQRLTDGEEAYRKGYISAGIDSAKAYKANNK